MSIEIANRLNGVRGSVVRQFAEASLKPGLISFANGNPSAETFPVEEMKRFYQEALSQDPEVMLQYGAVQGYKPLVETLKQRLAEKYGFDFEENELFITSGGTQAGDIVSKILLNENDTVITDEPAYGSFYNIFRSYQAKLVGVPVTERGMDLEALESALRENPNVKLIYTIPTFQNPSGFSATMETRRGIYELAQKYDVAVLEDDPYSELRFAGEPTLPIKTHDRDGRVFYTSSLSKVIAPSFRLGYLVVSKRYAGCVNISKQVTDVHSNQLAQYVANAFMTRCDFEAHLARSREVYRRKSTLIKDALRKYLHPSVRISNPEGGLFIMCFFPDTVDAVDFTWKAIERGVVCVPGSGFVLDQDAPSHAIRLCYSTSSDEELVQGAEIIGKLSRELLN